MDRGQQSQGLIQCVHQGSVLVASQRPSPRPLPHFGLIPLMTGPLEAPLPAYMALGYGTQRREQGEYGCSHRDWIAGVGAEMTWGS